MTAEGSSRERQSAGGPLRAIERVYEGARWLATSESQRMLVGTLVAADNRGCFVRVAILAVLTLILASCFHDNKPKDRAEIPKLTLDRNETVLPAGVREAWFAALDEAIEKDLILYQGRVRMPGQYGSVSYVPVADIKPVCGGLLNDISLQPSVVVEEDFFSSQGLNLVGGYKTVPGPELGVHPSSPAAANLMDDLCRHLVDRLDEMLAEQQ